MEVKPKMNDLVLVNSLLNALYFIENLPDCNVKSNATDPGSSDLNVFRDCGMRAIHVGSSNLTSYMYNLSSVAAGKLEY